MIWRATNNDRCQSWMVQILPFIDQTAVYNAWNFNADVNSNQFDATGQPLASRNITAYRCPSRPSDKNRAVMLQGWSGGFWHGDALVANREYLTSASGHGRAVIEVNATQPSRSIVGRS